MKKTLARLPETEAAQGERMIEIKVRFWTNNLASESGAIIQKHAKTSGVVRIEPNASHGIRSGKARPFNSLLDVGAAIEKVLVQNGVVLHPSRRMRKYLVDLEEGTRAKSQGRRKAVGGKKAKRVPKRTNKFGR